VPPTYLIFIIVGPVWTSAGMTAGIDLALAIEKESGRGQSPGLWLGNWSFITGAPVASRSFRRCWSWSPNPTVSRAHWHMRSAISILR
jgi:hypothetical protein